MKTQLLLLLFVLPVFGAFSQFSGTYTAGQPGDDFPDINAGLAQIMQLGVSGPVTLLVSDGEYEELDFPAFEPLSGDSLVIRSASGNPELVRFRGGNFASLHNVTLKDIGFYKAVPDNFSLVKIFQCYRLRLSGCRIVDNLTTNYSSGESTLKIVHSYEDTVTLTRVFVDSCYISSLNVQPYNYTVIERGSAGHTYYHADTILGDWDCWTAYYREFTDCFFQLDTGLGDAGNVRFKRCDLNFLPNGSITDLRAGTIDSCIIHSTNTIYLAVDSLFSSVFLAPVQMPQPQAPEILDNHFYGDFNASFSSGLLFMRNIVYSNAWLDDGAIVINNFFLDTTYIGGYMYHNNFGPNSLLECSGLYPVQQNNIHRFRGYAPNVSLLGNNFSSHDEQTLHYAFFDPIPTFYDPEYVSPTDLHIQNPALFSRGMQVTFLAQKDIDGEVRSQQPSIGADEACLQLPLRDTLFLECGTTYTLKSCAGLAGLHWESASVLGGTPANPTVQVDALTLVWLEDASGNIIDSMYLSPTPAMGSGKRTFEVDCGAWGYYSTYVPSGGTLAWEPASAVSNPFASQVIITPENDMEVIAHVDMGTCGTKSDTLVFVVNQQPHASILVDSMICRTFYFHTAALCYDSLLWTFSDGTSSTDPFVGGHTFPNSEMGNVQLIVWNHGLSDTISQILPVFCVGLEELDESSFRLYPNPANDHLKVEWTDGKASASYLILDQSGRIVGKGEVHNHSAITVEALSPGLYFLSLEGKQALFLKQ